MDQVPTLDGARFDNFEGFRDEVARVLHFDPKWNGHLDAFADLMFDVPKLRWVNAKRSHEMLGHDETARWLESRLGKVHASNRKVWELRVAKARRGEGETLFEDLTQLIRDAGTELELVD